MELSKTGWFSEPTGDSRPGVKHMWEQFILQSMKGKVLY